MSATSPLKPQTFFDGSAMLLELGPEPANILDREMIAALRVALEDAAVRPGLKAVVLRGAGQHFSYGASVAEHLPGEVESMLPEFHTLFEVMNQPGLPPLIAEVRGRCLGGGFELALACDVIAAAPEAQLGCPEIKLAVFPPAASAFLPLHMPASRAATMLLSGASISGQQALDCGLAVMPADAVQDWIKNQLLPLSAAALRQGRQATRWPWRDASERVLPVLEHQYLGELMRTADAREGLEAFLAKRKPQWSDQ